MSCIAEFVVRSPALPLTPAIERVPAMRLDVEQSVATDPDRPVFFLWASGGDFDAFEAAMRDDDTVGDPTLMEALSDRRLYRVQVSAAPEVVVAPSGGEVGASRLDARFTVAGLHARMRFSGREGLLRYRELCRQSGLEVTVRRLSRGDDPSAERYGLSEKQRRALELAAARGYFEVPRGVALSDLADELGISPQSTSERLRRGLGQLVSATVTSEEPSGR
ncbi:helix-turn-helix domain-containing protein [Haloferax marisrubri]|uniref:Helix-turn-helix domain-containing protein n=1 Tax=Haloferax marisrubri TaxID=1544719 RepID=A0A2P4NWC7_9EURY|nr:helix-turn-helix domain-containing protein [Haloferax marisrubri]POG57451.1 helix-turn-helix domain-containing protein [Haloferax marisrubri]